MDLSFTESFFHHLYLLCFVDVAKKNFGFWIATL